MLKEWILIVWILTPGGDFIDKYGVPYQDERSCQTALKKMKSPVETGHPLGLKEKGYACVTMGHWTGSKPMPGVPLD